MYNTYNEQDLRSATGMGFIIGVLAGWFTAMIGVAVFLYSEGLVH
jgi:hypothetical protein